MSRFVVGVTGHRDLPGDHAALGLRIRDLLGDLRRVEGQDMVALSALAEGADSLFAEAALELGIRLEVALPFEGYEQDFTIPVARDRFRRLLGQAAETRTLPYLERSNEAYRAVGRWIVDHADHLIAIWDGKPARGMGGTGDIVEYARARDLPLTIIAPGGGASTLHETDTRPGTEARKPPNA